MCDPSRYRWHLTAPDLRDLARHGHVIPISRGFTQAFLDEHYPGWTWNRIIVALTKAGVMQTVEGMPAIHPGVVTVHLVDAADPAADGPDACCVEWRTGSRPAVGDSSPSRG